MQVIKIKKGLDIPIRGRVEPVVESAPEPRTVALRPIDFPGVRPKLLVREGDHVRGGQVLVAAKKNPALVFLSPGGGTIKKIVRGPRRVLMEVVIALDDREEWESFEVWDKERLTRASPEEIKSALMRGGMWPYLRRRPLARIADPEEHPKAIYINGMDTEPLAANIDFLMRDREKDFSFGVSVLRKLTEGRLYLTVKAGASHPDYYERLPEVTLKYFDGPHPAGLVGVHIRRIDPLKPGEAVWYLTAPAAADIGRFFRTGKMPAEKLVALAGTGFTKRCYLRTRPGAAIAPLVRGRHVSDELRLINGSVLTGVRVDANEHLSFYNTTLTAIPEGNKREFMGWAMPGWNRYSLFRAFASRLIPGRIFDFDTRLNGGVRPIVNVGAWERVFPFDIHLSYLVRAILADDLEEAVELGLLELAEEDVALCTFACPSKIDVGSIIRRGLDLYEKESE